MKHYCIITKSGIRLKIKAERFPDLKGAFVIFSDDKKGTYAWVAVGEVVSIFDEEEGEEPGPDPAT